MNAAVIVPTNIFREHKSKLSFIPDQDSVKTFAAQRPYQALYVRRRIGCAIWNRYPANAHLLPEPRIECRSTRYPLACALHSKRTTELTKLPIVVVKQEFGLLLEARVPDLLLCPLERRMIGYVQMDDLSTRQFDDDEYIKDAEPYCVLSEKVTGPDGFGLVL